MSIAILNPSVRVNAAQKSVIFDLDGVLLDTEKLYARFWREAAVSLGYPMTHEQSLSMRSLNRSAGQAQLEHFFGRGIDIHEVRSKRIELMDDFILHNGVELLPFARETIFALKMRCVPMAIATSSPIERVVRYLGPTGLLSNFSAVITGYDVPCGKPAPDIYRKAADVLGYAPEECFAVEDSPAGLTSAFRAGCCTVFVPDQDDLNESVEGMVFAKLDNSSDLLELF